MRSYAAEIIEIEGFKQKGKVQNRCRTLQSRKGLSWKL